MMLFPAIMIGGHLVIAVVDKVPDLNFEPICREAAGEDRVGKDDIETCRKGETAARDQLASQWNEFGSADRTRCIRLSSTNRTASYVEVLTCLEMGRDAKKAHRATDTIAVPEQAPAPQRLSPPLQSAQSRPSATAAAPLALTPPSPPAQSSGILQALCLPGLKSILSACSPSGESR